jgi:hypothetical protein
MRASDPHGGSALSCMAATAICSTCGCVSITSPAAHGTGSAIGAVCDSCAPSRASCLALVPCISALRSATTFVLCPGCTRVSLVSDPAPVTITLRAHGRCDSCRSSQPSCAATTSIHPFNTAVLGYAASAMQMALERNASVGRAQVTSIHGDLGYAGGPINAISANRINTGGWVASDTGVLRAGQLLFDPPFRTVGVGGVEVLYTTNYDHLIEGAVRSWNKAYEAVVVPQLSAVPRGILTTHNQCRMVLAYPHHGRTSEMFVSDGQHRHISIVDLKAEIHPARVGVDEWLRNFWWHHDPFELRANFASAYWHEFAHVMREAVRVRRSRCFTFKLNAPNTRKRGFGQAGVRESTAAPRQVTRIFRWFSSLSRSGESESSDESDAVAPTLAWSRQSSRSATRSFGQFTVHFILDAKPQGAPSSPESGALCPLDAAGAEEFHGFAQRNSVPCHHRKILHRRQTKSSVTRTTPCRHSRKWRAITPFRRPSASPTPRWRSSSSPSASAFGAVRRVARMSPSLARS